MLPLLTITVFLSAALMFTLQPLVARLVLPLLGGSPAVWNTCMVFFQAMLLLGYAYAHALTRVRRPRLAASFHAALLVVSLVALPIALPAWLGDPPREAGQAWWLLLVLGVVAGLPMLAVSATAPLAQHLLASTRHAAAGRPYFLYAASNAGSLLALLSYPVVLEPAMPLRVQGWAWAAVFVGLIALASGAVFAARRLGAGTKWASPSTPEGPHAEPPPKRRAAAPTAPRSVPTSPWRERAWWLGLSALPSSLLLGVTTFLSTDVAAIPLLWVLPLAVYLGTFIVAFSERGRAGVGPRVTTLLLPLVALSITLTLRLGHTLGVVIAQQILLLLVAALACHVELARRAPAPARLTEFYLVVALGGVLGGGFNSLVAPVAFDAVLEYPIAIVGACLLAMAAAAMVPASAVAPRGRWVRQAAMDVLIAAGVLGLAWGLRELVDPSLGLGPRAARLAAFAPSVVIVLVFCRNRPVRFALALAALLVLAWNQPLKAHEGGGRALLTSRTFFGVHRVTESHDGKYRTLVHGTTVHGLQFTAPEHRGLPTAYYHPTGPIGHVFAALAAAGQPRRVAVVGLGAGALAAYTHAGSPIERLDFYEIDPEVVRIARDPALFTYIHDARASGSDGARAPEIRFMVGDGRLELARATDREYDLIVLDAFSSDAIPVHLLTREAFAVYLARLAPGGLIAIHISNRHVDLVPPLDALAHAEGLAAVFATEGQPPDELWAQAKVSSQWAAIGRTREDLGPLLTTPGMTWGVPDRPLGARAWTDDWSDVVSHLRILK